MEFIIYTDESVSNDRYFSSFYGGVLVRSPDWRETVETLSSVRQRLGLTREVKWQKVTAHYVERYIDLMDTFFDLVGQDILKVRVMFRQNAHVPTGLTKEQRENEYHLLYYQFLKHAFGLQFSNPSGDPVALRIYADQLPDTAEKNSIFKAHVAGLEERIAGVLGKPNFNVGITTGLDGDWPNRWHHPYRHWLFVPRNHRVDGRLTKP